MYKNKIIIHKREVIPTITESMILVDFCKVFLPIINFTTDDMTSKFECFKEQNECSILT